MKHPQKGFTLIELVVVITILGILASFAIPRFAGLETSARTAAINGLAGSVRAASALAHSVALVTGTSSSEDISMDGQAVTMVNLYPTASTAGIVAALQDFSGFQDNTDGTLDLIGAPTEATCRVTYTPAGVGGSPTIAVTFSGC